MAWAAAWGPPPPDRIPAQLDGTSSAGNVDDNKNLRKVLMLLATFATEITYTAGLSPPGGFQEDSEPGRHDAGDPTLQSGQSARLMAFYYCNTTAFVASLFIIVPLLSKKLQKTIYVELYGPTIVALLGLMGAYTAGSSREAKTIAYVLALIGAVLAYMFLIVTVYALKSGTETNGHKDSAPSDGNESRKYRCGEDFILLLASLAATITYQAGLDPPGGFWTKDSPPPPPYQIGDPILLSTQTKHYKAFFYCNSMAFAASLVVILIEHSRLSKGKEILKVAMILDLLSLIGAYAAGCSRDVCTSIYVVALAGAVLVYVVIHIVFSPDQCNVSGQEEENLEKQRERLLILAILVATIAYKAGLTPPGGFWQKDEYDNGHLIHRAGDPVLLGTYSRRYQAFFYCNATSLMASVALIILLVNPKLYRLGIKCYALYVCMVVGMFGLMGAYAAGSAREVRTSIYVFVLVGVVVAFLFVQLLINLDIREVWNKLLESLKSKEQHEGSSGPVSGDAQNSQERSTCKMDESSDRKKEYLMTMAILAASVTYQAGLQPPGGLFENGNDEGNPMLHVTDERRYHAYFYCNSTSFMASIVVIVLLLQQQYKKKHQQMHDFLLCGAMNAVIVVDVLCLLGAYAAGSCRDWETSGYVIGLAVFVLACIVMHFFVWWHSNKKGTDARHGKVIDNTLG